jgi:hypothetical protein
MTDNLSLGVEEGALAVLSAIVKDAIQLLVVGCHFSEQRLGHVVTATAAIAVPAVDADADIIAMM